MKVVPDLIGVFAVDPGETTGIGAGFYEPYATLKKTMTKGRIAHKTAEVYGDYLEQGRELASLMWRFQYTAQVEYGIPASGIHFVYEDFILRRRQAGGATGNLTSCWVAASATALYALSSDPEARLVTKPRIGLPINWQQPSEAYFYKNKLKEFGLYVRGSEHERVSNMHLICRISKLLG